MITDPLITKVTKYVQDNLKLDNARLGNEYYYQHLPLCVIDSVFSLGIKYEMVKTVIANYCSFFKLLTFRSNLNTLPSEQEQQSISTFIELYDKYCIIEFANGIYRNRCKTSTRSGILKAEAVLLFARVLKDYGINYFQDIHKIYNQLDIERYVLSIKGQSSGKSWVYFLMLAGNDCFIKPDRQIQRFLLSATGKDFTAQEAQELLYKVANVLKKEYPSITPRLLDYKIWEWQRNN